jgi:hypothetical protein
MAGVVDSRNILNGTEQSRWSYATWNTEYDGKRRAGGSIYMLEVL